MSVLEEEICIVWCTSVQVLFPLSSFVQIKPIFSSTILNLHVLILSGVLTLAAFAGQAV